MALLAPDASEVVLLRYMLNHTASSDVKIHLYSNNKTPAEADVLGDYTENAESGYAAATLTGTSFAVSSSLGTTTASYAERTFTFSTAATCYGYYITNNAANTLLWAERFTGAPFSIPSGGGTIAVTPKITLE